MNLLINFCLVLFVLVAVLMVLVILMQRPKSEGLGAAFGAGVTENIFGAQTTNVLVKFTTWLAGIFFAAHVCPVRPVCAPEHGQQRFPS